MKHLVVVNPKSFDKESDMDSVVRDVRGYFDSSNMDYFIHTSRYPRDGIRIVKQYVSESDTTVRVYSVGGDGILYDCLNGMMNLPNAQLAVIPYGTTNDFVRAFGENKQQIFRDIEKQARGAVVKTDVLSIGARYALSFCSVGVESASILKYYDIVDQHPRLTAVFGKHLFIAGAFLALLDENTVFQEYELVIDGVLHRGRFAGVNISNTGCYGGDKTPVPMAHPADGHLDVIIQKSVSRPVACAVIRGYTKGRYYKYPKIFSYIRAKEVLLRSDSRMCINADGEAYYGDRVEARILPEAVNIVAPEGLKYVRRAGAPWT